MSRALIQPIAFHPARLEPLVHVRRGSLVESVHLGAIAVVDARGQIVAQAGDPGLVTFLRSTAKPFQLLPLVESGGAARFDLDDRHLAVMAASHSGTPDHVALVEDILGRIGADAGALQCGAHVPYDATAAAQLDRLGQTPSSLHNNCSGKHAGMLALAKHRGDDPHDYLAPDHPVQRSILETLAALADVTVDQVSVAIDGCSAPCFALPLSAAGRAFAQLARPAQVGATRGHALQRVADAMGGHPELVAGDERVDTLIMQATGGRVLSKSGAESIHGLALRDQGLGVVLKMADGQARRAIAPVALEILHQLDALDADASRLLEAQRVATVHNHRGLEVGAIEPCFTLRRHTSG